MADDTKGGFFSELFTPVAGFGVTFSTMFHKVATQEYPEKQRPTQPASTGATSSTVTPTAWRSASDASCARGPARPAPSWSRARTTPRPHGSPRASVGR